MPSLPEGISPRFFQALKIATDPIAYVLCSLKIIPSGEKAEKLGISSIITMSRKFYIGQSLTGLQRISQHCSAKDSASLWEIGVAFYSNNFTLDIVHTLERIITKKASEFLTEYALYSGTSKTFAGCQEFPLDAILPFIDRILRWFGIEPKKKEGSVQAVMLHPKNVGSSRFVVFENPDRIAKLSLNISTGEIKLLKESRLASSNTSNTSLSDGPRKILREIA